MPCSPSRLPTSDTWIELPEGARTMRSTAVFVSAVLAIGIGAMQGAAPRGSSAPQAPDGVAIDDDDIGGPVTSSPGPAAGVWVIAQTPQPPTEVSRNGGTHPPRRQLLPGL